MASCRRFGIQSLEITGSVEGNLAGLTIDYDVVLAVDGPVEVPLRLDSQTVGSAVEGTKLVKLKSSPENGWSVELEGRGHHRVKLGLLVPVKVTAEGPRIELAIPEVSSTTLDLRDGTRDHGRPDRCEGSRRRRPGGGGSKHACEGESDREKQGRSLRGES